MLTPSPFTHCGLPLTETSIGSVATSSPIWKPVDYFEFVSIPFFRNSLCVALGVGFYPGFQFPGWAARSNGPKSFTHQQKNSFFARMCKCVCVCRFLVVSWLTLFVLKSDSHSRFLHFLSFRTVSFLHIFQNCLN